MTQQPTPPGGGLNLRGAVDLAALAARNQRREQPQRPGGGAEGGQGSAVVLDVTEETFNDVVQQSVTVPVVVNLWSARYAGAEDLTAVLADVVTAQGGRVLLANIDMDANPRLAQAFQTQAPMVLAVVRGQPVPLFQGSYPREQVEQIVDELLRVAEANGVTGRVDLQEGPAEEPEEEPLPPLHQEAYDAIEAGDLDAAVRAFERALAADPRDVDASAGLAQVRIMQRTQGVDPAAARAAAADAPQDVQAQVLAADLDLLGGHVEDAFARLLHVVRTSAGEDREAARAHLVELFTVVGPEDPRVAAARVALSRALF